MMRFDVSGMSCAACQSRVEKAVCALEGVESCSVSLLTNSMSVEGAANAEDIVKAVEKAGYGARLKGSLANLRPERVLQDHDVGALGMRLAASCVFLLALMYVTMGHNMLHWPLPMFLNRGFLALTLLQMILSEAVMIINGRFFKSGFSSLAHRSPGMDSLVALGSGISFVWSVSVFFRMCQMAAQGAANADLAQIYHDSLYFESAAMIPALITVGKLLEAISKGKTANALKSLVKLQPKKASVLRHLQDGAETEIEIDAADLMLGDIFLVRPGDSIPADGVVLSGSAAVDQSALTGESVPVDKAEGDEVSAATINMSGFIKCRAVRTGSDTLMSQVIAMVEDAAASKAPIARIADKVCAVFVPSVLVISLAVLIGWLLAGATAGYAVSRAICVLVISCPCALGLAVPTAIMVGCGVGARNGILIRNAQALESVGKVKVAVFDKTGTITEGRPAVVAVTLEKGVGEDELLKIALCLEQKSSHPLARAITRECLKRGVRSESVENFRELPGQGVEGEISGVMAYAGNARFISGLALPSENLMAAAKDAADAAQTAVFIAKGEKTLGFICIADQIKASSADAIMGFKSLGIRTVMLTGDNAACAKVMADAAGVDEFLSDVMPDGKAQAVSSLKRYGVTAMIGDGINDAPAMAASDVAMAIGGGTDVAIESSSIVLVNSDLNDALSAVRLGRGALRNIRENLFWAFFYNLACIPMAAGIFGLDMSPMVAAAAMSLSSVTVCLNALRLNSLRIRPKTLSKTADGDENELSPLQKEGARIEIKVSGMMCQHCEKTVEGALEALDFVKSAKADCHGQKVALVLSGDFNEEKAGQCLKMKGYEYGGIV